MSETHNETTLLCNLKGAPASLALVLSFYQQPLTARTLSLLCGYSRRAVRDGLARMIVMGLVRKHPNLQAYSIVPGHPLAAVLAATFSEHTISTGGLGAPALHESGAFGAPNGAISDPSAENAAALPADTAVPAAAAVPSQGVEISDPGVEKSANSVAESAAPTWAPGSAFALHSGAAVLGVEKSAARVGKNDPGVENSDPGVENSDPAAANFAPSRPRVDTTELLPTTTADLDQAVVRSSKQTAGEAPSPESIRRQKEVRRWLVKAGVGWRSATMLELLQLDLDPGYVAAHVLEFLATEAGIAERSKPFTVGLLIRRLRDSDPAPAKRCPTCLKHKNKLGLCDCDLQGLIVT